jgi:hypothetical protein
MPTVTKLIARRLVEEIKEPEAPLPRPPPARQDDQTHSHKVDEGPPPPEA